MAYTPGPIISGGEWNKSTVADGDLLQQEFDNVYKNCNHFNKALPPVGAILGLVQGYYSDDQNGGFAESTVDIGDHFYLCDGTVPNDSESPVWNASGRHVPNLTDERFLMGTTAAGNKGGSNDVAAQMPEHSHGFSLNTSSYSHYHSGSFTATGYTGNADSYGHRNQSTIALGSDVNVNITKSFSVSVGNNTHSHTISGTIGSGSVSGDNNQDLVNTSGTNVPKYLSVKYYIRIK